jgi:hypothetical protein
MNGWIDTRVAIDNYCRNHPEVTQTRISRPVIIVGCPRTASTFMHKLLAKVRAHAGRSAPRAARRERAGGLRARTRTPRCVRPTGRARTRIALASE